MNQLEFNVKVAAVVEKAVAELRAIVFAAAKEVQTWAADEAGKVEPLIVELEDGAKAVICAFSGVLTVGGSVVDKLGPLLALVKAVELEVAKVGVALPKATKVVADLEAEAEVIGGDIVAGVKGVIAEIKAAL
jgi:hypothetical protein